MVVDEDLADHIDLNFGCPVPKVTRKGGGSALPYKRRLFEAIVRTAVTEAGRAGIPVTVKMRIGIDDDHITYLDAGRIAQDCGVAARRAARPDGDPALLRHRRLDRDRPAQGDASPRSRCSATATSSRRPTRSR